MADIWGKRALTARAAMMVLGCNPASDATPTGNASGISAAAARGGGATSPGGRPGVAASPGPARSGRTRRPRWARVVDYRLLLRCQRRVLRLRGGDLTQQLTHLACSSARTAAADSAAALASAADISHAWAAVAARSRAD